MKEIKAWWWRDRLNLGDVLTPYIIEHLSGQKCKHIGIKWTDAIIYILKRIYARLPIDWSLLWPIYFIEPEHILGVGSILDHKSQGKSIAWGSGFLRSSGQFFGKDAVAVRGKYSAELLSLQGYSNIKVWGDPALLLPLIKTTKHTGTGKLAIIPNFAEYNKFQSLYGDQYDVISFMTDDIEGLINNLCTYDYILSSSLHGLIIAHAYGIPAIWIEDTILGGDTFRFKYRDYFSSVGIDFYDPFRNIEEILNGNIPLFFKTNEEKSVINVDLHKLQKDLLSVAPFPVLEEYTIQYAS